MTEETLFQFALQKTPAERATYLAEACGSDERLRQRVERLLAAHDNPGSFLAQPAVANNPADIPATSDSGASMVIANSSSRGAEGSTGPAGAIGTRIGPYKLLQVLGEGGMGTVYLAEQEQPVRRRVALKIIKPGMDSAQVIARFEAERQALAMMDHPNIARVLDAGTTEAGRPYFVMELVKGIPVTRFCDQEHLTPRERLALFIPVCQAVQHAHQKGIIHRDLKPSNVLIALYDGRPVPKVIDFGVAKATSQRLTERTMFTEVGSIVGTLEYMAPEQAELNNLDIDTRADIFSLGILLYELLTGTPPFTSHQLRSAGFTEMLRLIREVEPPKPSTRLSSSTELPAIAASRRLEPRKLTQAIHGDLDWIVMKALEKDRGRRYETASAMAADVEHYLHDEPVLAGPPSVGYRLRKFVRRNRTAVITAAAIAVFILAALLGQTVSVIRARQAEADARDQRNVAAQQAERATQSEQQAQLSAREAQDHAQAAQQERDTAQSAKEGLRRALYASDLNLAQVAWEQNNVGRILELLERHQPQPGEDDLRGFEWRYWQGQGHADIRTRSLPANLRGDSNATLEFSADGSRLVMNTAQESVGDFQPRVFDTATGAELFALPLLRSSFNNRLAFNREGTLLACAGRLNGGWLKVYDIATGNELVQREKLGQIGCLALSPDGKWVAATGCGEVQDRFWFIEGEGKVWEVATGREVCTIPKQWHSILPNALAFSPDGKQLAGIVALRNPETKLYEMEVKTWDAATGQELRSVAKVTAFLSGLAYSQNGKQLAARYFQGNWARAVLGFIDDDKALAEVKREATAETGIVLWEADTGKELFPGQFLLEGGLPAFGRPAFSPDGQRLAAGSLDRTVRLWDLTTGRQRRHLKGHAHPVAAVTFSGDGSQLLSAEEETGMVKVWNAALDDAPLLVKGHRLVLSPCGTRLAALVDVPQESSHKERSEVTVLDFAGRELCKFLEETEESSGVAFSPDGTRLATLSSGRNERGLQSGVRTLRVRDSQTGNVNIERKLPGSLGRIVGNGLDGRIAFRPDGKRLFLDGGQAHITDSRVYLTQLDAATGHELLTVAVEGDALTGFTFNRDGSRFASQSWWGPVKVWETDANRELLSVPTKNWQDEYALSLDGLRLATANERDVHIRTIDNGEILKLKGHSQTVTCLAFSPDGRRIASGTAARNAPPGSGHEVKLWDAHTGQELLTLKGHSGGVMHLMFSPDGHRLLSVGPAGSGGQEFEVRIWDASPLVEGERR